MNEGERMNVEPTHDDVVSLLEYARELVAQGWTQGQGARSAAGDVVVPWWPEAACWCPVGALAAVGRDNPEQCSALDALDAAAGEDGAATISQWNDKPGRSQAEVLCLIDRVIETLRRAG